MNCHFIIRISKQKCSKLYLLQCTYTLHLHQCTYTLYLHQCTYTLDLHQCTYAWLRQLRLCCSTRGATYCCDLYISKIFSTKAKVGAKRANIVDITLFANGFRCNLFVHASLQQAARCLFKLQKICTYMGEGKIVLHVQIIYEKII